MADITMCNNEKCSLRNSCYRKQATPDYFQSWAAFVQDDSGKCEYYWDMEKEKISD